jgi:hypothetical protein
VILKIFNQLKLKWGIESNLQIIAILVVFTLAGPTVVFIKNWYFNILGFDNATSMATKTIAYLLFIFPAYQVLLLLYGFLLGQFRFFWEKEKALARMIWRFGRKNRSQSDL